MEISWIPAIISLLGLALSWYAYNVEQYAGRKKGYFPLCDINSKISCTKALTSEYRKTFGVANTSYGIIFYLLVFALACIGEIQYILIISAFGVIASFYLAYLQYFKIKTFCLVCSATYLVNIALLVFSYLDLF